MLTTVVFDPEGNKWLIELRLIPHRKGIGLKQRFIQRFRQKGSDSPSSVKSKDDRTRWYDFIDAPIIDSLNEFWILLAIIASILFVIFIGWPLLLLLLDFIWLVLTILGAIVSFVILRKPVIVAAQCNGKTYTWKEHSLFAAQNRKKELLSSISAGIHIDTLIRN